MNCYMKCGGKVWIKIFFYKFYIEKGVGVWMGNGKGIFVGWVVLVKCNKIMFEVVGVLEEVVCEVLCLVGIKLFVKIKIVKCEEVGGELDEG